jgi:transcription elongation factor Elf1
MNWGAEEATITCPHCWEEISVVVDLSVDGQSYVEDCSVCCRPITITYAAEDGQLLSVEAEAAD